MSFHKNKIASVLFCLSVAFSPVFVFAETFGEMCDKIAQEETFCQGQSASECRATLEKCAAYYDEESQKISEDLSKTEKEKKTLQSQVSSLKKKVQDLGYQIKQGNVVIKDLGFQIKDTETSIDKTSLKIQDSQEQIVNILRSVHEENQKPLVEILITGSLSDFFDNLIYLEGLNSKISSLLNSTKDLKSYLEGQKEKLDDEKSEVEKTVKLQTLKKQESELLKKEQEGLLKITESEYQKRLQEKQETEKKAASIKARIFELIGVPKAPTFGEAYEIAKYVSGIVEIRPSFLLAVLQQESSIGKNVGQCYLTDAVTGRGVTIKTGKTVNKLMPPGPPYSTRNDVAVFKRITEALGRDPFNTPISCPLSVGWGGAMGPAQFIPTTWAKYEDRIRAVTGKITNPWDIRDAFLAAGLYLSDYGAKAKNRDGEWKAAMIYFSGSTTNRSFYWYANNVIKIASGFESDIKILEQNQLGSKTELDSSF